MVETVVKLNSKEDIEDFVRLIKLCTGDIKVYCNRQVVEKNAITAILDLDFSVPVKFKFEIDGEIPAEVKDGMKKYIV